MNIRRRDGHTFLHTIWSDIAIVDLAKYRYKSTCRNNLMILYAQLLGQIIKQRIHWVLSVNTSFPVNVDWCYYDELKIRAQLNEMRRSISMREMSEILTK